MALVETVRGPVETSQLGPTLMHEHVFILDSEVNHNYPERSWEGPKQARIAEAAETLRGIVARGIDTIVDLTVLGLGRSIPNLQAVNAEVDINIVVATGVYTYRLLPDFIHNRDDVLPALRERGVEEPQIEQMLVANPQRLFEQQGAY